MNSDKLALLCAFLGGIFTISAAIITINPNLVFDPQPNIIDIKPDPASPQARGTSINWTANAYDKDDDQIYYKFQIIGPSTDYRWKDGTDWSKEKNWIWKTSNLDIGNYTLQVQVTDRKFRIWDANDQMMGDFVLTYSAEDWYNKGLDFYKKSRYEEAFNAFNMAIMMRPDYAAAWYKKGETLTIRGNYSDAVFAYQKTIAILEPDENTAGTRTLIAEAKNGEGIAFLKQNYSDKAILHFKSAISINPFFAEAWKNLGDVLIYSSDRHDYSGAVKAFDEAIKLNPQYADAWNGKANALKLLGQTTKSERAYAKAKELGVKS